MSLEYIVSVLPAGSRPNTGIALIGFPYLDRPAIIVSCGRHKLATCYLQFPVANTESEFQDRILLCEGNFTNVSVADNFALFSGGSGSGNVTASQIFEISFAAQTITSIWKDPSSQIARNGTFVQGSRDFIVAGYDFDSDGTQISRTSYYKFECDNNNLATWKREWNFDVSNPFKPVSVGISSNHRASIIGQRIAWNKIDSNNFIASNICLSSTGESLQVIDTGMQTVACYIGEVIGSPSAFPVDDFIFVGGGEAEVRAQSFLLTRKLPLSSEGQSRSLPLRCLMK